MKKIYIFFVTAILSFALSGCFGGSEDHTVKIAVMGNEATFYPGYKEGIERAERDLNKEYADSGYTVECEFYSDSGSYEEGSALIDAAAADESIDAVIGSMDMDISKTAAYVFDNAEKLFVMPFFLYDDVYEDNNYETVFSLCNSAQTVGEILRLAAAETTAKRWAVCAGDGKFEQAEMRGFLQYGADNSIQTVDCVSMPALEASFDEIYSRWETLGVEGVIMFPEANEGFEILKKIKSKNPAIICGGDTAFDNSTLMNEDKELMQAMNGFIFANEFTLADRTQEDKDIIQEMVDEYTANTGNLFDTWYIQGYNAVRIIADTAIKNKTVDSSKIAEILHKDGYQGLIENFSFDAKGRQENPEYQYSIIDEKGYSHDVNVKK